MAYIQSLWWRIRDLRDQSLTLPSVSFLSVPCPLPLYSYFFTTPFLPVFWNLRSGTEIRGVSQKTYGILYAIVAFHSNLATTARLSNSDMRHQRPKWYVQNGVVFAIADCRCQVAVWWMAMTNITMARSLVTELATHLAWLWQHIENLKCGMTTTITEWYLIPRRVSGAPSLVIIHMIYTDGVVSEIFYIS